MAGNAKPNGVGKEGKISFSSENNAYGDYGILVNGEISESGYGGCMLATGQHIEFTIINDVNIYAYGGDYHDIGGRTPQKVNLLKKVDNEYIKLGEYDTKSSTDGWYLLFNSLEAGTYRVTTDVNYVVFAEWYVENKSFVVLKQNNNYYSINENLYNTKTKMYEPITDLSFTTFNDYGFTLSDLYKTIVINDETFKPIDKFNNFKIVQNNNKNIIKIKGIKYNKGMSIANGDFSLRLAENIDYFHSESLVSDGCSIKFVVSKDSGTTWLTTTDDGVSWIELTHNVPMKNYSELTSDEKTQWDNLMTEIDTQGILISSLNSIDFNTLKADKLRFAYVLDITNASDINIITKLKLQFDSIGSYEQMNNDTDVNISITNNAIKIKPLKDCELMKINVGISSDKSLVDGITYPTKEELDNYLDKTTYASRINEGYIKKAESAKTLELDSSAKLNGNRMYIGTSYGGDADSTEVRLREFPVGSTTDRIDTLTYPILTKDVPKTIEFLKEIPEVNCFIQAFEQEEGTQDITEVFESYTNPLVSNHSDGVLCNTTSGLSIKDSYEVIGTLNDGTGFYKINLSGLDSFVDINNITSEVNS